MTTTSPYLKTIPQAQADLDRARDTYDRFIDGRWGVFDIISPHEATGDDDQNYELALSMVENAVECAQARLARAIRAWSDTLTDIPA